MLRVQGVGFRVRPTAAMPLVLGFEVGWHCWLRGGCVVCFVQVLGLMVDGLRVDGREVSVAGVGLGVAWSAGRRAPEWSHLR